MSDSTTKRCSRCGVDKPLTDFGKNRTTHDGLQKWCKECRRAYSRSDVGHQRANDYADAHRERKRELDREYIRRRADDPPRLERRREWFRDKYQGDPDFRQRMIDNRQRYERDNPSSKIVSRRKSHNRRAKVRAIGGSFTNEEWLALCERYDHRCLCCGEQKPLTMDHIVPINKGGSNDISNIQPLCFDCNRRKGTKETDYRPG